MIALASRTRLFVLGRAAARQNCGPRKSRCRLPGVPTGLPLLVPSLSCKAIEILDAHFSNAVGAGSIDREQADAGVHQLLQRMPAVLRDEVLERAADDGDRRNLREVGRGGPSCSVASDRACPSTSRS